jgi:hypothetical protein
VIDINSKVWPVRISTQRVEEASRPSLLGPWRRSRYGVSGSPTLRGRVVESRFHESDELKLDRRWVELPGGPAN